MSSSRPTISDLAHKVIAAKSAWEDVKLRREEVNTEYEYAEKLLVLARQGFELESSRMSPDDDWRSEVTEGTVYPEELLAELRSIELVRKSIGEASRSALIRLNDATLAELATHMQRRGFLFATEAPAREIHGALLKQPWARKDNKTDRWEYVK